MMTPLHFIPSTARILDLSFGQLNHYEARRVFIRRLHEFQDLHELDISGSKMFPDDYERLGLSLQNLRNIKVLKCRNCNGLDFETFCRAIGDWRAKLKVVDFTGSSVPLRLEYSGNPQVQIYKPWTGALSFGGYIRRQTELEEIRFPSQLFSALNDPSELSWFNECFTPVNLKVVVLGNNPLRRAYQESLATCLARLTQLEHIDFGSTLCRPLHKNSYTALLNAFSSFPSLQYCSLAGSRTGTTVTCQFLTALPNPELLTHLDISEVSTNVSTRPRTPMPLNIRVLIPVLRTFSSLTCLVLSKNNMRRAPEGSIFELLSPLVNLQNLHLESTGINDAKVKEVAQACALMPSISLLNIRDNNITRVGSGHLLDYLQCSQIASIYINNAREWSEKSRLLTEMLARNWMNKIQREESLFSKLWDVHHGCFWFS